ncbi:glycosyltransferase family 4 protein [Planococcus liqunii]|uniref:glycosyltransferase family 4 protein n=1 Tax=Planococcus liqunii TaxID=3058394 RepID=UPI002634D3EA|nr:glycosyltransferase family 4 protein [Planococcus sp. N056]WKA50214.1 glycosyltransferase family 4 protein [Planococcus sp. N056]
MKVLWVTNHYLPDLAEFLKEKKSFSGSWLVQTVKELSKSENIEIHVLCPSKKKFLQNININGIVYHTIPTSNKDKFFKPTTSYIFCMNNIIKNIKPDIIHLHGSEFAYSQAYLEIENIPVILSIQGLISQVNKKQYYFGGIEFSKFKRVILPNEILKFFPLFLRYKRNKYRSHSEIQQLKSSKYVIGRTEWDKAHTFFYNSNVNYFSIQEIIRDSFFNNRWKIDNVDRITLFCAGGYANPIKGAHKIIECAALLVNDFPSLKLRIVGSDLGKTKNLTGYNKYLHDLISSLGLWERISFTGNLNEESMQQEFLKAHVYVLGSSIENSSNTLGEAMVIGTPIVTSYVGGISSLVSDEKEALFYRFGDIEQMAWQIKRILKSDELATNLSEGAMQRARIQYSKEKIINEIISTYKNVIEVHAITKLKENILM